MQFGIEGYELAVMDCEKIFSRKLQLKEGLKLMFVGTVKKIFVLILSLPKKFDTKCQIFWLLMSNFLTPYAKFFDTNRQIFWRKCQIFCIVIIII